MKPLSDIHPLGTTFLIKLIDSSKWELESITELHMAPWAFGPFLNSTRLSIGGAWCGLFNTLWAIIYNNSVCIIKACSIDVGFDGGGLELAGFLPSESLNLQNHLYFGYPLKKRSTRGHKKGSLHLLLDEVTSIKAFWHPNDTLVYGQEQEIWNFSWAEKQQHSKIVVTLISFI